MINEEALKRDYFKWHYEHQDAVPADIADFWINKMKEQLEYYENCPQCTGLREEYKNELKNEIMKYCGIELRKGTIIDNRRIGIKGACEYVLNLIDKE